VRPTDVDPFPASVTMAREGVASHYIAEYGTLDGAAFAGVRLDTDDRKAIYVASRPGSSEPAYDRAREIFKASDDNTARVCVNKP